jgi:hypothetical protein
MLGFHMESPKPDDAGWRGALRIPESQLGLQVGAGYAENAEAAIRDGAHSGR